MKTKYTKVLKSSLCFIFTFILYALQQVVFAQIHPGTGGSTPCASCVPSGWSLDAGTPDISDATQWGYNGKPWTKTIPPIPNGETTFMTAHSTEVASMIISGLTSGNSYTLVFYYMAATNSQPVLGGYGSLLSPVIRYSMDGGSVIIRNIAAEATWYKENVVFTATGPTAKFTFFGGSHDGFFPGNGATEGDLTNISFAPNSVVPTVGVPTMSPPPGCAIAITVNNATICNGKSVTLIASGASSYVWSTGSVTDSIVVSPSKSSSYSVKGSTGACSATASGKVTVLATPTAEFTYSPKPIGTIDPVITFSDRSSPNVNYWYWDFGDGDTMAFNTKDPVHAYSEKDSTYKVQLTVRNASSCESSISHNIIIGKEISFYLPNAFSPNDDNLNDVFGVQGNGIENYQLLIFDRWGKLIFVSDTINKAWNGKVSGGREVAQQDVYVWKLKLIDALNKEHDLIGTVTLVKGD